MQTTMPSAGIVFDTLFAYQKSAALKAAIDEGASTPGAIARRSGASERGVRILVTNFLHHVARPTCTAFLKKVHAALKPGGQVVVLEFVPNPDRVSPPIPASFSLTMLAGTPAGDAYTLAELQRQLEDAGFESVVGHGLPVPQTMIVARKRS